MSQPEKEPCSRRRICVSIAQKTVNEVIESALQVEKLADVIEIRLDSINSPEIAPIIEEIGAPLLFTNRPTWEGGSFEGSEEERVRLLHKAVKAGAAYVDIEIRTENACIRRLCEKAREHHAKVIISWHNFKETPSSEELQTILMRQQQSGANIGKIVTMAHDFTDVLRVLQLQEAAHTNNFPLCAFCMGRAGMISRLATLELGGYMTYAAPGRGEATAPGQLAISDLISSLKSFPCED
ncbi:MAG: type I 3-dehydroquinate dehydratase [Desulfobulbaceae bacterium]|nr:type I 3-dehydroquinate dehydratase [Desulfobulbaceae bacterium]